MIIHYNRDLASLMEHISLYISLYISLISNGIYLFVGLHAGKPVGLLMKIEWKILSVNIALTILIVF